MPLKTYRYAVCGGSNLVLDTVLFFVFYHFVFFKQDLNLFFVVLKPHIASLFSVFPITLITGFLLNKYITFQDSNLDGAIQFRRYLMVALGAIFISYFLMRLFVDVFGFYATPSKIATLVISVLYSYILQSRFSFKTEKS